MTVPSTLNFTDIEMVDGEPTRVFFCRTVNLPLLDRGLLMEAQVPDQVHVPQGEDEVLMFQPESIGDWHEYVVVERRVRLVRKDDTVSPSDMQLVATYTLDVVVKKGA